MELLPKAVGELVKELSRLPSIGGKSALRLAFHVINPKNKAKAEKLAAALIEVSKGVSYCPSCFYITENGRCPVCTDTSRDSAVICVVEKASDLLAIERCKKHNGAYHVLHGLWSPLRGVSEEDINLPALKARVEAAKIRELILALPSSVEGDATSMYIAKLVQPLGARVTRLGQGLSRGSELEYADEFTLSQAFNSRNELG